MYNKVNESGTLVVKKYNEDFNNYGKKINRKILRGVDNLVKINNTEWKIVNFFLYSVCLSISLLSIFPFVNNDIEFGVTLLIGGMFVMILMLSTIGWPVTIKLDEEKIVVYRFGKEINRIKWQQVTEIYEKDFVGRTNLAQFYFSDGQDRFLNDKNGNEHFITFRCGREKACLFSKFTEIPIQKMENEK